VVREILQGESHLAAGALLELRSHHGSVDNLTQRIDHQRATGYRIVASLDDDGNAAAVAGFRIGENTAWGRFVYVDDLVTRASARGHGHADAVMAWLDTLAREEGCDEIHLDSGVGPDREDAHRFYFRHRMRITAYHFARSVDR